jgi:hypothetical protein
MVHMVYLLYTKILISHTVYFPIRSDDLSDLYIIIIVEFLLYCFFLNKLKLETCLKVEFPL